MNLKLLAKIQYAHRDDRDAAYVLYEKTDPANPEFIVWTESSTGDRYWGHYFPYANEEQREAMYWRAHKCFLYLAGRKYNLTMDEEEAFI